MGDDTVRLGRQKAVEPMPTLGRVRLGARDLFGVPAVPKIAVSGAGRSAATGCPAVHPAPAPICRVGQTECERRNNCAVPRHPCHRDAWGCPSIPGLDRKVVTQRKHPKATGFLRNLYKIHGVPEEAAQHLEIKSMKPLDTEASTALSMILAGQALDAAQLSAWTRYVVRAVPASVRG